MTKLSMEPPAFFNTARMLSKTCSGLRFDIAFADDVAVFVRSGLSGDK